MTAPSTQTSNAPPPLAQSPRAAAIMAYAAPALPLGMLYFPVYVYLPPFYASRGVDLAALGAILLGARLLDAVTDPAMGVLSDRLTTRWGRRRPWLALACLPILLAAWQLFMPPAAPTAFHAGFWLVALTLAWTMAMTPYYAWGAEMASGYADRARVTSWRESAGLIGAVLAAVLYAAAGTDTGAGLSRIFLALAILLPVATLWAMLRAPEPRDWSARRLPLRESITAAAANRPFLRLLAAYFINGAANGLPAALFLFFVEHRIGAPDLAGPLLALYFLAAIIGAPVWARLAGRFPKHRVWCGAMIYACAIFLFALTLEQGDTVAFGIIAGLSGLALGADLSLPPAMQADVVDADTAATGEQRTGAYFAVWSVATKAALAVAGGGALAILAGAGFDATAGSVNDVGALWTLSILYAGVPVALKLIAVWLVWGFEIDAEAQAALRARIEA
ncbi:MAG: Na+/melibiose symporter-like transporter [Paracoccaceae bacterium]|jgi:Na+/melibiose symporter-like transporter